MRRKNKSSFFEKLTGAVNEDTDQFLDDSPAAEGSGLPASDKDAWPEENEADAELTVDVFQTPDDIIIQTIVAGVNPSDIDVSITREMVTVSGRRFRTEETSSENYFHQELYWGGFTRTILLPEEIDVEESEAKQKDGLLTIRLPKIDKKRKTKLQIQPS